MLGPVVASPGQPSDRTQGGSEWEIRWLKTYSDIGTVLIQLPIWVTGPVLGENTVKNAFKVWQWIMYVRTPVTPFLLSQTLYAPCVLYSR